MDGAALIALRTAAASAVAAAALASEPVHRLAVIGSGVQARAHARAIAKALPIRQVRVYSRRLEGRESAAADLAGVLELDVGAAGSVEDAVRGADVVALCTHSATPVLLGDWVEPGAVVISVGSNTPDRREVDDILLERAARIVVDQRETAVRQGGPVIRALELGAVRPDQLVELGRVLVGEDPGRVDPGQVLFYNSVGLGVQDAAAAWVALHRAREIGLGRRLDLS
jgi:ornithine cyclodeaminase